jgi:hypothetical protein
LAGDGLGLFAVASGTRIMSGVTTEVLLLLDVLGRPASYSSAAEAA